MERSWKPTAAGVLAIIAGALNIIVALAISLLMPVAAPFQYALFSVGAVALLWMATGIVAIIGGVFSLRRRRWGMSLAGAICALVPPSTLLGIISTVFVALAREEFTEGLRASEARQPAPLSPRSLTTPDAECEVCESSLSEPSEGERNA
ncbi:MAG: hypothetical protein JXA58_07670 [Dehalococcoidia bacterium]|nr:hypothetical protein [Dehalococcoidia bacterium]